MQYINLMIYTILFSMVLFILLYNWVYAVRIRTSSIKIGAQAPKAVTTLLLASIIISVAAVIFLSVIIIGNLLTLQDVQLIAFI